VTVLGAHLRDAPTRIGALSVAILGAAGTTFILVAAMSIANGLKLATARAGSESMGIVISRDVSLEAAGSLSDADVMAVGDALNGRSILRNGTPGAASPELVMLMDTVSKGGEFGSQVLGRGIGPFGLRMRREFKVVAGRMFTPGTWEVIVGRQLARDFAGLTIGQSVTGSVREWKVVGIFEDGGGTGESEVWMDLNTARAERGSLSAISSVRLNTRSAEELAALRALIETDPRHRLQVLSARDYQRRQSAALIRRVQTLAISLALILGIGAIVASINTMYSTIAARQRSLATLQAIGFGARPIAVAVFVEAVIWGILGGVVGGLAAYGLADGFGISLLNSEASTPIALEAVVTVAGLIEGIAAGALIGILAAILPSVGVARMPVLAGLRSL
jgi:putative ABC transport system permease protein